jgi:hypothetical protein
VSCCFDCRRSKPGKAVEIQSSPSRWPRILALYDQAAAGQIPAGGRVICVDEFSPLNLQPRPGRGWFPRGRPDRRRATYTRTGGVRHLFAALDLASGTAGHDACGHTGGFGTTF